MPIIIILLLNEDNIIFSFETYLKKEKEDYLKHIFDI